MQEVILKELEIAIHTIAQAAEEREQATSNGIIEENFLKVKQLALALRTMLIQSFSEAQDKKEKTLEIIQKTQQIRCDRLTKDWHESYLKGLLLEFESIELEFNPSDLITLEEFKLISKDWTDLMKYSDATEQRLYAEGEARQKCSTQVKLEESKKSAFQSDLNRTFVEQDNIYKDFIRLEEKIEQFTKSYNITETDFMPTSDTAEIMPFSTESLVPEPIPIEEEEELMKISDTDEAMDLHVKNFDDDDEEEDGCMLYDAEESEQLQATIFDK